MAYILLFLSLFAVIFLYFLYQLRKFIAQERASKSRLEANLTLLNCDMEKLEKEEHDTTTTKKTLSSQSLPAWDYPPEKEMVISKITSGENAPDGWDYQIRLDDQTENYLGSGLFKGMERRVASIPGIEKCVLKDREVFLLRSSAFSEEILVELFWREFLHAAELAHMKKK